MKGTMEFTYDAKNDIILATAHWKIESERDVLDWYQQWASYLTPFGRKMDFVVVLDDFEVKSSIGGFWGEYRAKVHQQFVRFSYRVHSATTVKMFINTSGIRFDVATSEAATVEDGVAGIKHSRKHADLPDVAPQATK